MTHRWVGTLVAGALLAALLPGGVVAADPPRRSSTLPDQVAAHRLANPIEIASASTSTLGRLKIAAVLRHAPGPQRVAVRLSAPASITKINGTRAEQRAAYGRARAQQAHVIALAKRADRHTVVLGRTGKASNLVMLTADDAALATLAGDDAVTAIVPIKDYALDLSATVPYVGGKYVQGFGWKGQGVDVAVLDTGIDYTHAALGGAGTEAAFKAAYGTSTDDSKNTTLDGLFPTARVRGGYDFVGEGWPAVAEAPDADPIDSPAAGTALGIAMGTDGGHGTHVADIIGGKLGMASRANLYAVKVCSSISTSCSGVALMNAMDWVMDPNGDGYLSDHVDIVNMSLGSDYGSVVDDDLSLAVERASHYAGILTVAAAGNGGNQPYISGTPAGAPSALAVAQTQVPSAKKFPLVVSAPVAIAGTYKNVETVDWAPLGTGLAGDVVHVGQGCPAGSKDGDPTEDPYLASPAGKVALIDRGACAVSLKVDRATKAGAVGVLIGLVTEGDAVTFSYGGGDMPFVPTMIIQQALSEAVKAQLAVPATVTVSASSAVAISLVGGMAGSSSRGPSSSNRIKPEIGAPGASVSAVSGSGTGTQAFGGTSGATPMVAGAAAQIKSAFPKRSALEIKALLMNTAETTVYTDRAIYGTAKAPITRIGGGELRVSRALKSPIAVWDAAGQSGSLSFGFVDGTKTVTISRKLTVRNYTTKTFTFAIKPTFRYTSDKTNGAVKITAPTSVRLTSHQTKTITVSATIYASKLRTWSMNGAELGNDPTQLDVLEYDGYINFDRTDTSADNADPVHVAWQVLPRKSGDVRTPNGTSIVVPSTVPLQNVGVGAAIVDFYSLVGTSPDKPASLPGMNAPVIDLKAVGVQSYPVAGGPDSCGPADSFVYAIAVSTWDRQTTSTVPGEIDVDVDTTGDGKADYVIFSAPATLAANDARAVTWVYDIAGDSLDAWFTTDNGTNDSNHVLYVCGDQLGLEAGDFGKPLTMNVTAYDWYYRDYAATDAITDIRVAPMAERFGSDTWARGILALTTEDLEVVDWSLEYSYPYAANPSETGLLLLTNAWNGDWYGGAPKGRESIQLVVAP